MKSPAGLVHAALLTCSLAVPAFPSGQALAEPANTYEAAEKRVVGQLEAMQFRISMFHHEARSSLLASLALPVFTEYFSLPESRNNQYDSLGAIKISPTQARLRVRMEEWAMQLHKRFPIGEVCLVDRHGQEHMRTANGHIEPPSHFSDAEHSSPFFQSSFDLALGQVHLSQPYMSPDSYRWVVAFTSPIVLENGDKPAFFHFEVPLAFYQTLITTKSTGFSASDVLDPDVDEEGRYFILEENGLVVADSQNPVDLELKAERHPEKNLELPDYLPPERLEQYLLPASNISAHAAFLKAVQEMRTTRRGVTSFELDGVHYVLAFQSVPDRPWILAHLDPIGAKGFWEKKSR